MAKIDWSKDSPYSTELVGRVETLACLVDSLSALVETEGETDRQEILVVEAALPVASDISEFLLSWRDNCQEAIGEHDNGDMAEDRPVPEHRTGDKDNPVDWARCAICGGLLVWVNGDYIHQGNGLKECPQEDGDGDTPVEHHPECDRFGGGQCSCGQGKDGDHD